MKESLISPGAYLLVLKFRLKMGNDFAATVASMFQLPSLRDPVKVSAFLAGIG